ncbi:MAG: NAD(P)H-hydrate dehydratase [Sulfolobales archaeon]|nr:NAD(P)H-hydrate dehydratase [Sulfolobales archaeon]MCG2884187.1 NAD(P)H-hydrate dehydratase [Sulfolobales archaeon]
MITVSEMRALEINSEALGVPTRLLMENAGRSVKDAVIEVLGTVSGKEVIVFVGHGGKGGDGLVSARHLAGEGARVSVFLLGEIKHADALANLDAINEMDYSVKLIEVKDPSQLTPLNADVLIDAMLGTGVKAKVREPFRTAIEVFNESKGFKVSIDVPSGIDPDTGEELGVSVQPDLVVTFHDLKPGLVNKPFKAKVAKIGIPPEAEVYVGPGDLMVSMRPRRPQSKKGDYGRLLIIGGSETFYGAPTLAAMSAMRASVDLVYVAAPEETAKTIASYSPDLITIKLKGRNLNPDNVKELVPWIERANAVVLGPGMGMSDETVQFSQEIVNLLLGLNKPVVLDADALKANKGRRLSKSFVITPHAGEFAIYFGSQLSMDVKERIGQVIEGSKKCDCVVLAKGYVDVIADGSRFKLNKTGNPGMTVGGTGDTLAGLVGAFLAMGLEPYKAAYLGAFVNGLAGSLAYAELGPHITASDLVYRIPQVMNDPLNSFKKKTYKRILQ